jgi:hypothetical protein
MKRTIAPSQAIRRWIVALLSGPASLGVSLGGQPASAQSAARDLGSVGGVTFDVTDGRYLEVGDRSWVVPRRAPRELFARSQVGRTVERPVGFDSSVLASPPLDHGDTNQPGGFLPGKGPLTVAGIRLGTGPSPMLLSKRYAPDTRCDCPHKCGPDKGAVSSGFSLDGVSSVGWIVGAVNLGLGAFLLMTNDRKTGAETSIGADIYRGGGGLKFRRSIW